jgi:two-component sensor histidine kinase
MRQGDGIVSPSAQKPARARAIAIIAGYVVLAALVVPWATRPGPELPGIIPFFVAGLLVAELAISFLLFFAFRDKRTFSLLLLGSGYLYSALMTIPHLLTFPGAFFSQGPVLGTQQSAGWVFLLWILGYALMCAAAVVVEAWFPTSRTAPEQVSAATAVSAGLTTVAVALVLFLATVASEHLPPLVVQSSWTPVNLGLSSFTIVLLVATIGVILSKLREADDIFLWLAMALAAIAVANLLSAFGGARYTVGWTLGRVSWVISGATLFLYFMRESARHQKLLAQANEELEHRVAARTAELTRSLGERDLLLREVYHRVKNNLQLVDSLIGFQASRMKGDDVRSDLTELRKRVSALGLVHQQLMQSSDLATLDVRDFLERLCLNLGAASAVDQHKTRVSVTNTAPQSVPLDFAVPLGLLTTELVSNALKNTLNGGRVDVSLLKTAPDALNLTIAEVGFVKPEREANGEVDARIINALVAQLGGRMTVSRNGSKSTTVVMPPPELRQ